MEKLYNLEERTLKYSKGIIQLCKRIPSGVINAKLIGQLISSSGSVGANYREANEALSKKDFAHRMRITRKECKESTYWLELLMEANETFSDTIKEYIEESKELRNIFTAILNKAE